MLMKCSSASRLGGPPQLARGVVTYPGRCSGPCWELGWGFGLCPCLWGWSCFQRTDSVLGMSGSEEVQLSWVWLRGSVAVWILPPVNETGAASIYTKSFQQELNY